MMIDFEYLFKKYDIKCNGILHCGASFAQEKEMYEKLNVPEVIWIEAIPDVYEQLVKNINGTKNHVAINACLSDVDGKEVEFKISNNEAQSSSFLELGHHLVIHPTVHYVSSIKMITTRLDTLLKDYDISNINFGNFDLQGAELLALKGLGKLINQFDYLYLEVNKKETYKGCALIDEVDNYLSQYNFKRVETGKWVADTWTDALYIKA